MTRPGKIPSQARFEPRIFRSRGGCLNLKANEAVVRGNERTSPVQIVCSVKSWSDIIEPDISNNICLNLKLQPSLETISFSMVIHKCRHENGLRRNTGQKLANLQRQDDDVCLHLRLVSSKDDFCFCFPT